MKRVFIIVLDSLGIGAAPDADKFGDLGANTLKSCFNTGRLDIPNLMKMGFGKIEGTEYLGDAGEPCAAHGRLRELSMGKDTTIGHFELAGVLSTSPLPTYPNGFPHEVIERFEKECGKRALCNKPYSGTEVIRDYGKEHLESGDLIVYTSADSVFQIAAHEELIPPEKLYEYCRIARSILTGKHAVGRVIARPFITENGKFKRTANRRDFSLEAPGKTVLDAISEAGLDVISVGKIRDIFAGRGVTSHRSTHSNTEGLSTTLSLLSEDFHGLAFVNLVDFDSSYGHRQDPVGYAESICEFDRWLPQFCDRMSGEDLLIITADHGCDPSDDSTDHTREYVPLLVYGKDVKPKALGTRDCLGTVGKLACDALGVDFTPDACEIIGKEILL